MMGYERARVKGRPYLVCADCRRPLTKGYNPMYWVPQPGMPVFPTDQPIKQTLCGPDYLKQWAIVQPDDTPPDLADGYLGNEPPIPFGVKEIKEEYADDYAMWEAAVVAARGSNGAETVEHAFRRISGASKPDVEMSAPTDISSSPTPLRAT